MLAETSLNDFIGGDWVYASFLFWPATFKQAEQYGAAHSLCGALGESADAMSCGRCGAMPRVQGEDKQGNRQKGRFWKEQEEHQTIHAARSLATEPERDDGNTADMVKYGV